MFKYHSPFEGICILIAGICMLLISCDSETVYGTFHVKCYSQGTVIFDEEVVTSYLHSHRGDVWWRNDGLGEQRGITEINGDCVVRRLK